MRVEELSPSKRLNNGLKMTRMARRQPKNCRSLDPISGGCPEWRLSDAPSGHEGRHTHLDGIERYRKEEEQTKDRAQPPVSHGAECPTHHVMVEPVRDVQEQHGHGKDAALSDEGVAPERERGDSPERPAYLFNGSRLHARSLPTPASCPQMGGAYCRTRSRHTTDAPK